MINLLKLVSRQKVLAVGIVATIVLAGSFFVFITQNVAASESDQRFKIIFDKPVSLIDLSKIVQNNGINPTELNYKQGDIQGGYTLLHGESIDEALDRFAKKHNTFLALAIAKTEKEIAGAEDDVTAQRVSGLLSQLKRAQLQTAAEGLKVDSIEVNGNIYFRELDMVKSIEPIDKISYKIEAGVKKASAYVKNAFTEVAHASACCEAWAPYGGGTDVNQNYTYQTFYFDNVSSYGGSNTYEHETQVYDSDFADYDGYWSSNMPNAYYAQRF